MSLIFFYLKWFICYLIVSLYAINYVELCFMSNCEDLVSLGCQISYLQEEMLI